MKRAHPPGERHYFAFASFCLEPDRRRLWHDGTLVPLYPKSVEALTVLIRHAGEILLRERLIEALWPDAIVEDSNLSVAISHLRKALAEHGGNSEQFIETIPRVGYRFVGEARETIEPVFTANGDEPVLSNGSAAAIQLEPILEPKSQVVETHGGLDHSRRWLAALAAIAAIAGAFLAYQAVREDAPFKPGSISSVAVLPLKGLTGSAGDDYLVDGLTEDLIHSLSKIRDLKVISRGSVFHFRNQEIDPEQIGRRLRVSALVEGSVQQKGDRAFVLLRLVRTKDGKVLWSTQTSADTVADLFQVEDGLAQSLTVALRPELAEKSASLFAREPTSPEALQAYLKGVYFLNKRTADDLERSIIYFKQAIERDPKYALAYAGLADAHALLNYYGGARADESYPPARQAAERALELDESLAQAHASLAYIKRAYDWDWAGAEREFKRAIELNPNYATAHFWYGEQLSLLGRFEEGIAEISRAAEIDPLSPIISASLGWAYHMAGKPDLAIAQLEKTLELDRNYAMTHFYLGMAYEGKGMYGDAINAYAKSQEISPLGPGIVGLGHAYGMSERRGEAERILQELKERVEKHQARPTGMAIVAAGLGDADSVFAWMERAYEERAEGVIYLKAQPYFANVRADPRRAVYLQRLGLAD